MANVQRLFTLCLHQPAVVKHLCRYLAVTTGGQLARVIQIIGLSRQIAPGSELPQPIRVATEGEMKILLCAEYAAGCTLQAGTLHGEIPTGTSFPRQIQRATLQRYATQPGQLGAAIQHQATQGFGNHSPSPKLAVQPLLLTGCYRKPLRGGQVTLYVRACQQGAVGRTQQTRSTQPDILCRAERGLLERQFTAIERDLLTGFHRGVVQCQLALAVQGDVLSGLMAATQCNIGCIDAQAPLRQRVIQRQFAAGIKGNIPITGIEVAAVDANAGFTGDQMNAIGIHPA